jgi:hypothetical protein
MKKRFTCLFLGTIFIVSIIQYCKKSSPAVQTPVIGISDIDELYESINNGTAGASIQIGAGIFTLSEPLQPKSRMTIKGAGIGKTILQGKDSWYPNTDNLTAGDVDPSKVNRNAYLINLGERTVNVTISEMTLTGPRLHGALFGDDCDALELYNLSIEYFRWSGIRTFRMSGAKIHDNTFIDAGGTFETTGGAFFLTWVSESEFWNNHISQTPQHPNHFYGFKGRQGKNCRFHHNTVEVGFSLEFPFENDENVEIDHNMFTGPISIPKWGGGPVPTGGYTFHIHHNWLKDTYALEWPRNGAEVDHNFFDFDRTKDPGNLISNFAQEAAEGPTKFHDNEIRYPGRGLFWSEGIYNQFHFYNNRVITTTTVTPRNDGLFGLNTGCDFSTIEIKDNIIECIGLPRPLMRNNASYSAKIVNNRLINVSDSTKYSNPDTGSQQGPIESLYFKCGVNDQFTVDLR